MNNTKFALGLSLFIVGGLAALVVAINPAASWNIYAALGIMYVAVFGLGLLGPQVPPLWRDIHAHRAEAKKFSYDAAHYGEPQVGQAGGATVENATKAHIGAWRAWWLEVFVYAAQNGGVVSWKDKDGKGLQNIVKRHEHWLNYVVGPFNSPQHRWLEPAYQGGKTKLREGVSVWFIVNELSRGNVPPAPLDAPPPLKSGEFETVNSSENSDGTVEKELQ